MFPVKRVTEFCGVCMCVCVRAYECSSEGVCVCAMTCEKQRERESERESSGGVWRIGQNVKYVERCSRRI